MNHVKDGRLPFAHTDVQEPRANAQHLVRADGRGPAVSGTAEHMMLEEKIDSECQ